MRIIIGIGNPGSRYALTRHNAGFLLLDHLAESLNVSFRAAKGEYYSAQGSIEDSSYLLVKPTTYVNLSGIAARQAVEAYGVLPEDVLVLYDDINLPNGKLRLRRSGGDGGHNGISSITEHLQTTDFPRLRLGIGGGFERGRMAEYVLSEFTDGEMKMIGDLFSSALPLLRSFLRDGIKGMLDEYSRFDSSKK